MSHRNDAPVLTQVIFAGASSAALLDTIDRPETRIVSLTITEHGYCLDRATRRLDWNHPLIAHDLANPAHPRRQEWAEMIGEDFDPEAFSVRAADARVADRFGRQ